MPISPRPHLKLVQFNVENLFLFLDLYTGQDLSRLSESEWKKLSSSTTLNKPLHKVHALKEVINDIAPDILMLNEVGGLESLENFNKYFLESAYDVQLKEGNSNRGIDVGYLVRKDLDVKTVLISHKNRPIEFLYPHETETSSGGKSHYFSRDVSELRLFGPADNSPFLTILLTHLKSKLDPVGIDGEGRLRRAAELKMLVTIYSEVKKELGDTNIVVAGDFNGIAAKDGMEPEFQYLHENSDLMDCLECSDIEPAKRFSQVQITPSGKQLLLQIDYILVSPSLKNAVVKDQTYCYRFKSDMGIESPLPKNLDERDLLPSDHYPVVLTLDIGKIVKK